VGLKKKRREQVIVLSGVWKFSRKLGVTFEMDYGENRIRRIYFSAKLNVAKKDRLIFTLYDRYNRTFRNEPDFQARTTFQQRP